MGHRGEKIGRRQCSALFEVPRQYGAVVGEVMRPLHTTGARRGLVRPVGGGWPARPRRGGQGWVVALAHHMGSCLFG
jgi:hypothetical protein